MEEGGRYEEGNDGYADRGWVCSVFYSVSIYMTWCRDGICAVGVFVCDLAVPVGGLVVSLDFKTST